MSKYTEEFPDFLPSFLPSPLPTVWEDTSWHNDACPSWSTPRGYHVFVDFPTPSERELPESKRFTVCDIDTGEVFLHTDVWEEVLFHCDD